MSPGVRALIALAIGSYLLFRTGPGALLCLFPGLLRQKAAPGDEHPPEMDPPPAAKLTPTLGTLGFVRLGVRRELFPLGASALSYDYFNAAEKTYASVYMADRTQPRLYFFTPYDGGASVLTADHKRPGAVNDGYYLAGGLVRAAPEQVWAAHKRQMTAMEDTGRDRVALGTLEDRIASARLWATGVGKREVRSRNLTALFSAAVAMLVIYVSLASLPFRHLAEAFVRR